WEFPFYAEGVAGSAGSVVPPRVRFKLYAQSAQSRNLLLPATRTLLRMWDEAVTRINFDHSTKHGIIVHVFICDGGKAGGEQVFIRSRSPRDNFASYNAIYVYHAEGLNDPVEAVREFAHEYGHAILPPVGGFKEPEEWANGSLGERLFMRYLVRAMKVGNAIEADAFGASSVALSAWLAIHADPLAATIARRRIDQRTLAGAGPAATNEYLGLMLLLDDLFPDLVGRALKLAGGQTAIDALKGAVEAVNEQRGWVIDVPAHCGSDVWLPIAGKLAWTGAKPLQSLGAWTKVRLTSRRISARRV
ncbi:MAG: hypothetical protein M3R13_10075, partial [Armatimonadota bacterium]|nr:hypothetical protein [Armatimonadota bacterium]